MEAHILCHILLTSCVLLFSPSPQHHIIQAQSNTANGNTKEAICNLVLCPPGLEDYTPPNGANTLPSLEDESIKSIRRTDIRSALHNNLHSTDTSKRSHRKKGNGSSMTFVEMNDIMCKAWKVCDVYGRSIFEELALEGRMQNVERIAEYERKYPHAASSPKKNKMKYKRRKSLPALSLTSTTIVNDPTQKMMIKSGNSQPLIMKVPHAPFSTPSSRNVMDSLSRTGIAPPPLNHITADDDYTFDQQVNNMGDYNTVDNNNPMSSHQNFPTLHPSMSMPSISMSDYLLPQFTDGMNSSFANFQSPTSVMAPAFMLGQSVSSEDVAGAFQANNNMMMQPPPTNPFDDPKYYDAFGNARPNTNFGTSMIGMMSQQAQALGPMMSQQAPALGPTPQADPQESEGEESLWDSLPALPTTSSLEEEKNEVSEDDFLKLINTMDGNLP